MTSPPKRGYHLSEHGLEQAWPVQTISNPSSICPSKPATVEKQNRATFPPWSQGCPWGSNVPSSPAWSRVPSQQALGAEHLVHRNVPNFLGQNPNGLWENVEKSQAFRRKYGKIQFFTGRYERIIELMGDMEIPRINFGQERYHGLGNSKNWVWKVLEVSWFWLIPTSDIA